MYPMLYSNPRVNSIASKNNKLLQLSIVFFKYNERKICKIIICDEDFCLINTLENKYSEILYFICARHKFVNIKKRLSENTVGEYYYKLLKFLPYNESF